MRGNRRRVLQSYANIVAHAGAALTMSGYWYSPQKVGSQFVPGELSGYFSDLRHKAIWRGPTDAQGLPLNKSAAGDLVHFPITVLQKGLGHWDLWLAGGRGAARHGEEFLQVARWARRTQDNRGGWSTWPVIGMEMDSPYSAMTQGEAISLLVRAGQMTGDASFVISAERATELMFIPVDAGGVGWRAPSGLVLEEYPRRSAVTVLNGWVFGLYGLYDFVLATGHEAVAEALTESSQALAAHLPKFDLGFWSAYDTAGNVALPFYQQLHIAQLAALERTFPLQSEIFGEFRRRFTRQAANPGNWTRAVAKKAIQKVFNPPGVVMR